MDFNLKTFLVENNLTMLSSFKEDDNTGLTLQPGQEEDTFDDEEEKDDWNKPSTDDSTDQYEKEPTSTDVKKNDASLTGIHKKQAQLQNLENQKDALVMQLKGDVISLDQYKQAIGNIPMQIKKLRADLDQAMNVTLDTDSEEEAI